MKDFSEETAKLIDEEVRRFVNEAYEEARKIIDSKEDLLHKLADALLKKEVLDGHEVEVLLTNGSLETEEATGNNSEEENN